MNTSRLILLKMFWIPLKDILILRISHVESEYQYHRHDSVADESNYPTIMEPASPHEIPGNIQFYEPEHDPWLYVGQNTDHLYRRWQS